MISNNNDPKLLKGTKVVSLCINTPGPLAAARLAGLGAAVTKVEPPQGDPLKRAARSWYDTLTAGQTVLTLDLKDSTQRAQLDELLSGADLLLASFRPSALKRLGLDWVSLHSRFPGLCFVGIIGYPPPDEERSGHDLTYLADTGLLSPPTLPRSLYVDLAGGERCASQALALLCRFVQSGNANHSWVSLYECAQELAHPFNSGLTNPGGGLGGASPFYSVYRTLDGWIAIAALEPHFAQKLLKELGLEDPNRHEMEKLFLEHPSAVWEQWSHERGLPLAKVK